MAGDSRRGSDAPACVVFAACLALSALPVRGDTCPDRAGGAVPLASAVRVLPACAGLTCRPGFVALRFVAAGRRWTLRLHAADGGAAPRYRGVLRGDPSASADLVLSGRSPRGSIVTSHGVLTLEPAADVCPDAPPNALAAWWTPRGSPGAQRIGAAPPAAGAPAPTSIAGGGAAGPAHVGASPPGHGEPDPNADAAVWEQFIAAGQTTLVLKNALLALGQENLVYNILNQTDARGMFFPTAIARDPTVANTRLFVADSHNSRVLGFECAGSACALGTGAAAVRVFGQPDFSHWQANGGAGSPPSANNMAFVRGVAVDALGRLFAADTANNRVLVYADPWNKATPDMVIGQTGMGGSAPGSGLAQLSSPDGVFVDGAGALWVADTGNNRVLKFATIATGAGAAVVLGGAGSPSATTLSAPRDVAVDGNGNLYVADTGFSRVLRYAPPLTSGKAATAVFGQGGNLASGTANAGGVSANSLAFPERVHVDAAGRLWICDTANNRVLEYDTPLATATATRVFGQLDRNQNPSFTTNGFDSPDGFTNAGGLFSPRGIVTDAAGRVWVSDFDNSRVVGFDTPLGTPPNALIAARVLGKDRFIDDFANQPTANRMNNPFGVAVDRAHTPNRLWVSDLGNHRVLGYLSTETLATNRAADLVLGQLDFTRGSLRAGLNGPLANAANAVTSNAAFADPIGVAVDSQGAVYVADSSDSRVVKFNDPFGTDRTADQVFGQTSFTSLNPNPPYGSAGSLLGPSGVSLDAADNLWIADRRDHRVVRISNAPGKPATGGTADLVLGQAGFVSSNTLPAYAPGCAANRMNLPYAVYAAPSGRLYVADTGNNRVLAFSPPFSSGMNASAVFGQPNLTSCAANRGGAAGPDTLNQPSGVLEDAAGNVLIADRANQRVLVYYTPFGGGDLVADEVMGQPNFTSVAQVPPQPGTFVLPTGLAADPAGRVYVADVDNSRVTRFATNSGPLVLLDALPSPIVVGDHLVLTGSGFTAGSRVNLFVNGATGISFFGPFVPEFVSDGYLIVFIPPSVSLGNGFGSVTVVNTDQGFIQSNAQSQYVVGAAAMNIPSITAINGVALRPVDVNVPVANVETVVPKGSVVTLTGTGFNSPLVNVYTATGFVGPLTPRPGWTSTRLDVDLPGTVPTGPGAFQVVNAPYNSQTASNAVSAPLGARISLTSVRQQGATIVVDGTGFCVLTRVNFWNGQGNGSAFYGPQIQITLVSDTEFTFPIPAGAQPSSSYVQVLNPPFIPFSHTGLDPRGAITLQPW
jgi:sugar lactone lactonase YvrE